MRQAAGSGFGSGVVDPPDVTDSDRRGMAIHKVFWFFCSQKNALALPRA
jgi:hypothetical protein